MGESTTIDIPHMAKFIDPLQGSCYESNSRLNVRQMNP
jgi:hypothetical protein